VLVSKRAKLFESATFSKEAIPDSNSNKLFFIKALNSPVFRPSLATEAKNNENVSKKLALEVKNVQYLV
jgi:hypothetical protein